MKVWLVRPTNDRLSVKQIFESLDIENRGNLSPKSFESALNRMGIRLKEGESRLLNSVLDQRSVGLLSYRRLVRELQGVPQQQFMAKGIMKMAQTAETKDYTEQ